MGRDADAERARARRVAAIDIGTNSVLLTIAEVSDDGSLTPLVERATITRLGEGVDKTRKLADGAIERTLACLGEYAQAIRESGASRLDVVGTSAMRDAAGGDTLVARAEALLGVRPRVISGDEEARLTFGGGLSGLSLEHAKRVIVFDIGGGSTEVIVGHRAPMRIEHAVSLDIGSVRLTERHIRSDPPTKDELARVDEDIERALDGARFDASVDAVVGVAGTVTTLGAIARKIDPYDAAVVHGLRLSQGEVDATVALLDRTPIAERVKLPGLSPKRADVIAAGAHICRAVLARSGATELVVSDRGVRWGLLAELAAAR
ncbi:MAG: Ppx/GppA family phosphatase [Polyangiaceae bacterium]|nr:Ppx/GppA family phosphatase [Polyangiaceae bacterium]